MKTSILSVLFCLGAAFVSPMTLAAKERAYPVDSLAFDGGADGNEGRITITAMLGDPDDDDAEETLIFSTTAASYLTVSPNEAKQRTFVNLFPKNGQLEEVEFEILGDFDVESVLGDNVANWAVQREGKPSAGKTADVADDRPSRLVVTLKEAVETGVVKFQINSVKKDVSLGDQIQPHFFAPNDRELLSGSILIGSEGGVMAEHVSSKSLNAVRLDDAAALSYNYTAEVPELTLNLIPTAGAGVSFEGFDLQGVYADGRMRFTLSGVLVSAFDYTHRLPLLSGDAALTQAPQLEGARVGLDKKGYWLAVDQAGRYPVQLEFEALVLTKDGRSSVNFNLIDAPLQRVQLRGMPVAPERVRLNAAPLLEEGDALMGSLSGDGVFRMTWTDPSWKRRDMETATLIYSAENIAQVAVGNGLIRQRNDFNIQILQGEMKSLAFDLAGQGEITRVESEAILSWKVEDGQLRLILNKAYSGSFPIQIHSQYAMEAFPVEVEPLRILPQAAIRHNGFIRIVNQGSVSIDVPQANGFAQISPEYFPSVATPFEESGQMLAYRFSDTKYQYKVRAENILPEVSVSQLLEYHVGQEDQRLSAELELTIREAPLRDFYIRIPEGYALANIQVQQLADYFVTESEGAGRTLRLVFSQPLSGRVLIKADFENNERLTGDEWVLPDFAALDVKSVRGHIGVTVDPGLRVSVSSIEGLSEQAANFFPKKLSQLQLALRMREPDWRAVLKVERLPQSIQVDALHLYSVAEGRVYGSSVLNFLISGAPVSSFQIRVPEGVQNLDFAGRDVRGWSDLGEGVYEVQLHSPASGAYTLLATYESQFEASGALVDFSGVTPLGIDAEQGYVVAVSNFPFALTDVQTDGGVLRLEPGEVPAEFRLLYDAKELAAFQYAARPMRVAMDLRSFEQAKGADQVIDFVELKSHISRDGEVLTAVDLMLKSKGQTHFRMQLPPEHRLWSARVAGEKVSPIAADGALLLPLPPGQDPNNAVRIQVELASQSADAERPQVFAPALFAPSLMVNWELTSDPGYGLRYVGGDLSSKENVRPTSGFAWLQALLNGDLGRQRFVFLAMLFFGLLSVVLARTLAHTFGELRLFFRVVLVMALLGAIIVSTICLLELGGRSALPQKLESSMTLRTPIEFSAQPLRLTVENHEYSKVKHTLVSLWPFLLGVGLWVAAWLRSERREFFWIAGWVVNFIAALHYAASGALFLVLLFVFFFICMLRPFRMRYLRSVGSHAVWLLALLFGGLFGSTHLDAAEWPHADAIQQTVVVEDGFARVEARLTWRAADGEQVVFLRAPATLLGTSKLPEGLRLVQTQGDSGKDCALYAEADGDYALEFSYQVRVGTNAQKQPSVVLPVGAALNRSARIELQNANIVLSSETAVSVVEQDATGGQASVYELVFRATETPSFTWMPKQRDSSEEAAVYHVESFDVFTPIAGLVTGFHQQQVRLAQGQLDRLELDVPAGMTITSVEGDSLANWQFQPEAQRLVCFFQSAQKAAFELRVFSQYAAGSLPYTVELQGLRVVDAASQIGLVALATDDEVQVGTVQAGAATTINLEDFPAGNVQALPHLGRVPVLRRAYRWGAFDEGLRVQALAVEPDLRVVAQQTVSLGEDRILIKCELSAVINRAGLFKLSMAIPADYDVESVSGSHLSHWNELVLEDGTRTLQLHLKGKTLGQTSLNLSFSGPGLGEATNYEPPVLQLDGAGRHNGTLALVPELGYRLNPVERKGALQLDPAEAGMSRQKLLLFRILNSDAALGFAVEQVAPWVEVEKLQRVAVRSGLAEVRARFNFNVENAGIRSQRFAVPEAAIGVQFTGDGVVDAQRDDADGSWVVKLNRKMVGAFALDVSYQLPLPEQPDSIVVDDVQALGVDQQSGFLALVPEGRIQLQPQRAGDAFQDTEVPMVAAKLRGDLKIDSASHLYRLIQPGRSLEVGILRHNVAELVPAQVRDVQLESVISGQGAMLTKVTLQLDPGDKRMLRITLPANSQFWFGFVNQQSVWPWREGSDVLLQLEASALGGEESTVEFFYATDSVAEPKGSVHAQLQGPRLDLPLENIKWAINYPDTWEIEKWAGNLTREKVERSRGDVLNISSYLEYEQSTKLKQKAVAETYLRDANELLSQGRQQEARQAFNSAYNLSQFDAGLNEDARVQLKNVREDQALVALANRRNSFLNDNSLNTQVEVPQATVIDQGRLLNYTDQAKKEVLRGNSAEENETLRLLAARLIDQQQAVPGNPQAIQTLIPQQGQMVTFTRSLQINDQADLSIELKGKRRGGNAGFGLGLILFLIALAAGGNYAARR